jgi:hypothetical protein
MKLKKMTTIFIAIGIVSFGIAGYFQFFGTKNTPLQVEELEPESNEVNNNKEKGNAFEDYVFDLVMQDSQMKLLSKASDYHKNGKSAQDNATPDFKFQYQNLKFSVECKYRSQFIDGKINWAKDYQIKNYNTFEKENNQKVYICIGIGGTSEAPEQLYFVPLYRLTKVIATKDYINEFRVKSVLDIKHLITIVKND